MNNKTAKRKTSTRIQIKSKPIDSNAKAKAILSKIDDILLDDYSLKDQMTLDHHINNSIDPLSNINNTFEVQYLKPIEKKGAGGQMKRKLNKFQPKRYQKGKSFMTDVGLIKQRKGACADSDGGYMKCVNEKVDEIINNIQDIDDHSHIVRLNDNAHLSKVEKEGRDFRQLLNDIDECQNQMQEDFDEVKYLIKFADNTHKLIGRHKNIMTNIFKEAGLRPKGGQYAEDFDKVNGKKGIEPPKARKNRDRERDDDIDNSDHSDYDRNSNKGEDLGEVFNKLKKINKIKDNLCNIQDDFFGYHQRLKDTMKPKH